MSTPPRSKTLIASILAIAIVAAGGTPAQAKKRSTLRKAVATAPAPTTSDVVLAPTKLDASLVTYDTCGYAETSDPFAPWGDTNAYTPVENGSFTNGLKGWDVVAKPRDYGLVGPPGDKSLEISAGVFTSPPICFDDTRPHSRMFQRQAPDATGLHIGGLKTYIVYKDATSGKPVSLETTYQTVAATAASTNWQPSKEIGAGLGDVKKYVAPDSAGRRWYRIRFEVKDCATWQVDDLYVDPRMRG